MPKQLWKPGNMVYPVPAALVSCADRAGHTNLLTVAWTGNICTNPPMVYISVRPSRYSYGLIEDSGEFVINLTTKALARAADYCGVRSGKDVDKWKECHLTPVSAVKLQYAPLLEESPVNIECRVNQHLDLGSHRMYLADVLAVHVDEGLLDESGKFHMEKAGLIAWSHGDYQTLGESLGSFGWSVKKRKTSKKKICR